MISSMNTLFHNTESPRLPLQRIIIHVDMDAFYASVEQRDYPELQGKPVVVGADPEGGKGRGVVCAASYEARRYGIHSAQPISRAYRLCPHAVFMPVRMDHYVSVSRRLMEIFNRCTPLVEAVSLDEAFLDLTGSVRLMGNAVKTAQRIKSEIRHEQRLTASIGIAPNKLLAKIASDLNKPDGFVVVNREKIGEFLNPLPVRRIWGVGEKIEKKLIQLNIRTIGDLSRFSLEELKIRFGRNGEVLSRLSRGEDESPVVPDRNAKSLSNEVTFEKDESDRFICLNTLLWLSEKVSFRMRSQQIQGKTVVLKIRDCDFTTVTKRHTMNHSTDATDIIYSVVKKLFEKNQLARSIRLLGVGITQLSRTDGDQTDLFQDDRKEKITRAVDKLKIKYGEHIILKGGAKHAE
jgi:DNA polymerase IV